jgi:hypothetical protein
VPSVRESSTINTLVIAQSGPLVHPTRRRFRDGPGSTG